MPTVSYGIANTADDVASADAIGFFADTNPGNGGGFFYAGFRFLGVLVPQGATITSATLTLTRDDANTSAGSGYGVLKGVAADNASSWSSVKPDFAAKTTQSVAITNAATVGYNVAAIVQAIVNRTGWSSGNALAFAGDDVSADGFMVWIDYGASSTNCAQLSITYTAGGPTNYTLTADGRSLTLSGPGVGLKRGRRLPASVRAFALTGQVAVLTRGRSIVGNAATYALVGQNAGLRAGRSVVGGVGAFSLTGQAVGLRVTRLLSGMSRSYVLAGNPALFETGKKLVGEKGTFSLTGRAAGLVYQRRLDASAGGFVLVGQGATLDLVRKMGSEAGVFVLGGQSAALRVSHRLPVEAGSYGLAGQDAGLVPDQGGNVTLAADRAVFLMAFGQASFKVSGWSPVPPASETWTAVPKSPETWTPVPKTPEVWS